MSDTSTGRTTLASVAADVGAVSDAASANASRLDAIEADLARLKSDASTAIDTAKHGNLVQDIVDFLHWAFPVSGGKPVPGTPSHLLPPAPVPVEPSTPAA